MWRFSSLDSQICYIAYAAVVLVFNEFMNWAPFLHANSDAIVFGLTDVQFCIFAYQMSRGGGTAVVLVLLTILASFITAKQENSARCAKYRTTNWFSEEKRCYLFIVWPTIILIKRITISLVLWIRRITYQLKWC